MGRWRASPFLSHIAALSNKHISRTLYTYLKPLNTITSSAATIPKPHFFSFSRPFSALPYPSTLFDHEYDSGSHDFDQKYGSEPHEDDELGKIPVRAFFLSTSRFCLRDSKRAVYFLGLLSKFIFDALCVLKMIHGFDSINLKSMQAENLSYVVPATSRSPNYLALKFGNIPSDSTGIGVEENVSCSRYMVVFQYGSAVLFNIEEHEVESYLEIVRRHACGLLQEMRKDDYAVKEKPLLVEDMQGGSDYIVLKKLDTDSIRIIGSVLGQSIALDYFVSQVDGIVEEFTDINRGMEKTGTFTMDRKKLFQLVGKANSNLADVILKVGLFDRSEIAWREAKYAQIFEYLREEYEVTQRFGNLDFKLKFVEHNIHFLQEALQNRKSDLLEWCIIVLLSIENVIAIYEIIRENGIEYTLDGLTHGGEVPIEGLGVIVSGAKTLAETEAKTSALSQAMS
ncbi:hypothetical protein RJ640_007941 [Escallonia rubra]|uniref:DUF155 domain-containing protein n=1 Tax=Escallonia rubra TaxID=112253 RepID=A0AA88U791_9ASTE|nr:hypothetical protein RJ640_007941 [Escallonia rubra]